MSKVWSMQQPLAWACLHVGRRIDNVDSWGSARAMIGQTFLIYASKKMTRREYNQAESWMNGHGFTTRLFGGEGLGAGIVLAPTKALPMMPYPSQLPLGAIVGRARLAEVVLTVPGGHRVEPNPSPIGLTCALCGAVVQEPPRACPKADPWAEPGKFGLILADLERITSPIPLRGGRGFFEVDDGILSGATFEAVGECR